MSTVVESPGEGAPPSNSVAARFVGVLFSPGPTFEDIARKPDFIAPLVALVVASVAVTETMLAKIVMERIVRMSIENPQNPVPSNVGFFLNPLETSKPLLAFRLSAMSGRKVKPTPIFLCYFGLWVVWVLAKGGLAMLTG